MLMTHLPKVLFVRIISGLGSVATKWRGTIFIGDVTCTLCYTGRAGGSDAEKWAVSGEETIFSLEQTSEFLKARTFDCKELSASCSLMTKACSSDISLGESLLAITFVRRSTESSSHDSPRLQAIFASPVSDSTAKSSLAFVPLVVGMTVRRP